MMNSSVNAVTRPFTVAPPTTEKSSPHTATARTTVTRYATSIDSLAERRMMTSRTRTMAIGRSAMMNNADCGNRIPSQD